jgi:hypothetical protein
MIEMKYDLLQSANILWKALEQIYGSSNYKRSSSTNVLENISSSSSMHFDQDREEQSSVQKEKVKSASLEKSDGPISQTGYSSFGRTEEKLLEEDNCSTSSSNDGDDDVNQVPLEEFHKLITEHMKLQKRYGDLLCSQ